MCVDYTNLNRAWAKYSYTLLNIVQLIDNSSDNQLLSFMDAYSGHNQLPMFGPDQVKITFMTKQANHQYNVMPFTLKNTGTTYHKMMNTIFQEGIRETLEV